MTIGLMLSLAALTLITALGIMLWPPAPVVGALLIALGTLALASFVLRLVEMRQLRLPRRRSGDADDDDSHFLEQRRQALREQERRLELRELRVARRMRVHQLADDDGYIDLLESHPSDAQLGELVETDRQLITLIEAESQLAFERVLENRYATADGVDSALIFRDVVAFVDKVARLYRPGTDHPLLETDIELVAKSASSTALHLLVVIDGLPIDLKSYNTATLYRLIRRSASYYGTYKAIRPYLDYGLQALHAARLALGANPLAVGATWVAGKLTGHGAKVVTEQLLQRQALQLLHDFVRVIGFEAAMVYGGQFRHRDVNWVLGAELVNLELSRGQDLGGRDAALADLTRLALRHEFDRVLLLRHLGTARALDVDRVRPAVVLTQRERDAVASRLAQHCLDTGVDLDADAVARWRAQFEQRLKVTLNLRESPAPSSRMDRLRSSAERATKLWRRLRPAAGNRAGDGK
jgi:hypothetical protein